MGDMIRLFDMRIRFWGTRGSIAAPGASTARYGGNTSCVEVRASDGTVIVLDCGTGARELGLHLPQTMPHPIRLHLFIDHTHWDHIQGFPFFVPAFLPGSELNIYAPLGFQPRLEEAMAGQMDYSYFPVNMRDLRSRIHFRDVALAAGVERLVLFHHDPAHDDATMERMEAMARDHVGRRGQALDVLAAREGLELEVRGSSAAPDMAEASALQHRQIVGGRVLLVSANEPEVAEIEEVLSDDGLVFLRETDLRAALSRGPELVPDIAIIDRELLDGDDDSSLDVLRDRLGRRNFPIVVL